MTPILRTSRLLMRPPLAEDLEGWAAFCADAGAMRFLGGAQPRSLAWRSMAGCAGSWALQGFGFFSVLLAGTGEWIGRIGPIFSEGWPTREIAWGLLPGFQGRGYAREAAIAAIDFAVGRLGWTEIGHTINPDNTASIALARALGSHRLGPTRLPAPYEDEPVELWGQTREAWLSKPGSF